MVTWNNMFEIINKWTVRSIPYEYIWLMNLPPMYTLVSDAI